MKGERKILKRIVPELRLRYERGMIFRGLLLSLLTLAFLPLSASAGGQTIVILGDSLTAGLGLSQEEAYPARLEERLKAAGQSEVSVVNAGVSGDTTAGGLRRLAWVLRQKPTHLVVALGANDMLRGLKPEETEKNLTLLIEQIKKAGVSPVLFGMKATANLGAEYRKRFDAIYPRVAQREKIPLLPFLLEGVAMHAELNQADGIHPNSRGQEILAERTAKFLLPLLKKSARPTQ